MHQAGEWVFNAPWWMLAVAGVGSVVLLLYALSRGDRKLARIGWGAAALAIVWTVLSLLVATPLERARDRTINLIRAYEAQDWDQFAGLIDPETRFHTMLKGQEITDAARLTHENLRSGTIRITSIEERRDDLGIVIDARILSNQDNAFARSAITAWRFDYRLRGEMWKLERIDPLATETIDLPTVLRFVQLPPGVGGAGRGN